MTDAAEKRFWARVCTEDDAACWYWRGEITANGYGTFGKNPHKVAHRISYELCVGPIPDGLTIDHLCRVRACVNPAHLEPVTNGENVLRGDTFVAKNAVKTHCDNGHPFDDENRLQKADGSRGCKACHRVASKRYRDRQKAAAESGSKISFRRVPMDGGR